MNNYILTFLNDILKSHEILKMLLNEKSVMNVDVLEDDCKMKMIYFTINYGDVV